MTGIRRRDERAEIVGMDAALPFGAGHGVRVHVDAERAQPRLIDLEVIRGDVPVPNRRLRQLERRTEFGGQRGGRDECGIGTGVHDRLLLSAIDVHTLNYRKLWGSRRPETRKRPSFIMLGSLSTRIV